MINNDEKRFFFFPPYTLPYTKLKASVVLVRIH